LAWLDVFNFGALSSRECLAPLGVFGQTMLNLAMPWILLAEAAVIAAIHYLLTRPSSPITLCLRDSGAPVMRFHSSRYISGACAIFLFSYTQVANACLTYLYCVQVGKQTVLFSAPSVDCKSAEYRGYLVPVLLMLCSYVILLPCAIAGWLWRHRTEARLLEPDNKGRIDDALATTPEVNRMAMSDAIDDQGDQDSFARRFAPLYLAYSPRAWFWQALLLIRRAAYVVASVLLVQDPASRFFAFGLLNFASLMAHLGVQPFRSRTLNRAETASYTALVCVSMLLAVYLPPYNAVVQAFSFLLVVPLAAVLAGIVVWRQFGQFFCRKRRLTTASALSVQSRHEEQPPSDHDSVIARPPLRSIADDRLDGSIGPQGFAVEMTSASQLPPLATSPEDIGASNRDYSGPSGGQRVAEQSDSLSAEL
jgi:hypothetical protein